MRRSAMTMMMAAGCALLGCAPTPESTFNEMKKAACAGDVEGFLAHVNRTKIQESRRAFLDSWEQTQADAPVKQGPPPSLLDTLPAAIRKGEAGPLCKMLVDSASVDQQGKAQVSVKFPEGDRGTFHLERLGNKWLMVDVK